MELSRFEDVLGLRFQHFCLLNSKDTHPSKESDHNGDGYSDDQVLYNNYILVVNKYGLLVLKKKNKLQFYKLDKLLDVESFNGGKIDQLLYSLEFTSDDTVLNIKYKESNNLQNKYYSTTNTFSSNNKDSNNNNNNNKLDNNDITDDLLLIETKYYIYVYNILNMKYYYIYNKKVINIKYHYELVNSNYMLVMYNNNIKFLELNTDKESSMNLTENIKMVSNINNINTNNNSNNILLVDDKNHLYSLQINFDNENIFNLVQLKYDLSHLSDLPCIDNVDVVGCYIQSSLVVLSLLNKMDLLILFCKNTSNSNNMDNKTNSISNNNKDETSILEIVGYCYNELYLMLDDEEEYYVEEMKDNINNSNKDEYDYPGNENKEVWVKVKHIDEWNLFVIYSNKSTSTLLVTHNDSLIKANSNDTGSNSNSDNDNKDIEENKTPEDMLHNNYVLLLSEGYNLESNEYGNNLLHVEFYYNYETEVYRKNSLADTPTLKNPIVAVLVLQSGEVLLYFIDNCYIDNTNKEIRVLQDINGNNNKDKKENNEKNYSKLLSNLEEYRSKNEGKDKKDNNNINNYYYEEQLNSNNKDYNTNNINNNNSNRDNKDNNKEENEGERLSELIDKYYKLGYKNYKNDPKSFKLFETLANCLHQFNLSVYSTEFDDNTSNSNNTTNNNSNNKDNTNINTSNTFNTPASKTFSFTSDNDNLSAFAYSFDNFNLKSPFSNNTNNIPNNSYSNTNNKDSNNNKDSSSNKVFNFYSNQLLGSDDTDDYDELNVNKLSQDTKKLNDYVMIVNKLLKIQDNLSETANTAFNNYMNNDTLFINVLKEAIYNSNKDNNNTDNNNNSGVNNNTIQKNILEYLNKHNNHSKENNNKQIIISLMNKLANVVSNCGLFPMNMNNTNKNNNTNNNYSDNNKWRLHISMDELPEVEDTMLYINTSLTNLLKRFEGMRKRLDLCYQNYVYKQIIAEQEKNSEYYGTTNTFSSNNKDTNNNINNYDYEDEEERRKEEERKRDFYLLERKLNEVINSLMDLYSYPSSLQSFNNTSNHFMNNTVSFNLNNNFKNFNKFNNNTDNNNNNTDSSIFNWNSQQNKLDQQYLPLKYNNYKKLFPTDKDLISTKYDKQDNLTYKDEKTVTVTKSLVEEDSIFNNLSNMSFGNEDKLASELKGLYTVEKEMNSNINDKDTTGQKDDVNEEKKKEEERGKKESIFSFGNTDNTTNNNNTLFSNSNDTGSNSFTSIFGSTTNASNNNTDTSGFGVTTSNTLSNNNTGSNLFNNTLNTSALSTNNISQVKFGDTNTKLVGYNLLDKGNLSETSFFSTINTSKSLFDIALNTNSSGTNNSGFGGFGAGVTSTFGVGSSTTTPANTGFNNYMNTNTLNNTGFGGNTFNNTGTNMFGTSNNTFNTGGFTGANCFTTNSFTGFGGSSNPASSVTPAVGMNTNPTGNVASNSTNNIWTSSRRSNPLD